jgi:hypothetical protein
MIYNGHQIAHGEPPIPFTEPKQVFVVSARKHGWCVEFIVIAHDAENAIVRLKSNAQAVIEAVRANMTPEDFEETPLFREPELADIRKARELEDDIRRMQEILSDIEENTDELSAVRRETLTESIASNYAKIKELRESKEIGKDSKFKMVTHRMTELLDPKTKLSAEMLLSTRCYTVSYFDDARSYTSYCG